MNYSNIIANTTRRYLNENAPEYRTAIGGSFGGTITITLQTRQVLTQGWRCVVDGPDFPAAYISGLTPGTTDSGPTLQPQRTTPMANEWYEYEEVWLTKGPWTNVVVTT